MKLTTPILLCFVHAALLIAGAPACAGNLENDTKALNASISKKDHAKTRAILLEIGKLGEKKCASVILQSLHSEESYAYLEAAIDALVSLGENGVEEAFADYLGKSKREEHGVATLMAVAERLPGERAERWLVQGVETQSYVIYRNAIPALVSRKSKAAIPPLIDLLEKVGLEPSAQSYLIRDALLSLTGQDFESIDDWRKFWQEHGAALDPKALTEARGTTGVVRKVAGTFKIPKFFEREVLSSRVLFVIDVSGSMRMWDKDGEKIGDGPDWQTRERLARMKFNLFKAVRDLPSWSTFNIIAFGGYLKTMSPKGSVPANATSKARAAAFIQELVAEGATHTDDAMNEVFKDPNVDTVFLLSDGAPMRPDKKASEMMPQILESVRQRNRIAKIKIHTLGFEGEGEVAPGMTHPSSNPDAPTVKDLIDFLTKLAEQNGGTYSPVK